MMRVPKKLLKELRDLKKYRRESYADVIKRLIKKKFKLKALKIKNVRQ